MAAKHSLEVLLVRAGSSPESHQSPGASLAVIEPPAWAGPEVTFLHGNGFGVVVVDPDAKDLNPGATATRVGESDPSLMAVVVNEQQPSAWMDPIPAAGPSKRCSKVGISLNRGLGTGRAPRRLQLRTKYISASEVLRFRDQAFDVDDGIPSFQSVVWKKGMCRYQLRHARQILSRKLVKKHA